MSNTNVGLRIIAGITTGAIAISCAQPTDVVKVRLQAQSKGGAKRYNGAMDAYRQIARKEGIRGLWKGPYETMPKGGLIGLERGFRTGRYTRPHVPCGGPSR